MTTPKFRVWDGSEMWVVTRIEWYRAGPDVGIDRWMGQGMHSPRTWDDDNVLMQYTGRTDAEKTEIYDGDVVEDSSLGVRGVVRWGQKRARWCVKDLSHNTKNLDLLSGWIDYGGDIHVIGDKYRTPDLLEQEPA